MNKSIKRETLLQRELKNGLHIQIVKQNGTYLVEWNSHMTPGYTSNVQPFRSYSAASDFLKERSKELEGDDV